jgi:hypothetical protein
VWSWRRPGRAKTTLLERFSPRRLPVRLRLSGRVSLSCRSDTPARAIAGGNGRRGRRSVTAVVTCHVKSSSVAWASLAPSSRSGQATSDASYRPRRTPSLIEVLPGAPYRANPALCRGSASAWPRSTPWPSTPTCGRPLGATRGVRALIWLRAGAERVGDSVALRMSRNGGSTTGSLCSRSNSVPVSRSSMREIGR